jgi:hypothetical protein
MLRAVNVEQIDTYWSVSILISDIKCAVKSNSDLVANLKTEGCQGPLQKVVASWSVSYLDVSRFCQKRPKTMQLSSTPNLNFIRRATPTIWHVHMFFWTVAKPELCSQMRPIVVG